MLTDHYLYGCDGGSFEGATMALYGLTMSVESIFTNGLGVTNDCDIGFLKI